MTRLELACGIYDLSVSLNIIKGHGKKGFVQGLLKGYGGIKPQRKHELQEWYDRLLSEAV